MFFWGRVEVFIRGAVFRKFLRIGKQVCLLYLFWPEEWLKSMGYDGSVNPILNVKVKGGYGVESQTLLSAPALMSRLLSAFVLSNTRAERTGREKQSEDYNKDDLYSRIGSYSRERMKIASVPLMGGLPRC